MNEKSKYETDKTVTQNLKFTCSLTYLRKPCGWYSEQKKKFILDLQYLRVVSFVLFRKNNNGDVLFMQFCFQHPFSSLVENYCSHQFKKIQYTHNPSRPPSSIRKKIIPNKKFVVKVVSGPLLFLNSTDKNNMRLTNFIAMTRLQ